MIRAASIFASILFLAALALPASAQITCLTCDFNDPADPQGWVAANGPYLSVQTSGGTTQGCLQLNTQWPMYVIYLPSAYQGDWSALDGAGSLQLDLQLAPISSVYPEETSVMYISGPGGSAHFDMETDTFGVSSRVWAHLTIPLFENRWIVDSGTWSDLMADVSEVFLQFYINGALQSVHIDNVRLGGAGCEDSDQPLSENYYLDPLQPVGFVNPYEAFRHPVDGNIYALVKETIANGGGLYRATGERPGTRVAAIDRPDAALANPDGSVFVTEAYDGYVRKVAYPFGENVSPPIWVSGFHSGDDDPSGMCSAAHVPGYEDKILVTDLGNGGYCQVWMFDRDTPQNEVLIYDEDDWAGEVENLFDIAPYDVGESFAAICRNLYYSQMQPGAMIVSPDGAPPGIAHWYWYNDLIGVACNPNDISYGRYELLLVSESELYTSHSTNSPLITGWGQIPRHGVFYDPERYEVIVPDMGHDRIYRFRYQTDLTAVPQGPRPAPIALEVSPNPANPRTRIAFELPQDLTA